MELLGGLRLLRRLVVLGLGNRDVWLTSKRGISGFKARFLFCAAHSLIFITQRREIHDFREEMFPSFLFLRSRQRT